MAKVGFSGAQEIGKAGVSTAKEGPQGGVVGESNKLGWEPGTAADQGLATRWLDAGGKAEVSDHGVNELSSGSHDGASAGQPVAHPCV